VTLRAEAFAKINRELRVGGRRPDGYHELLSRFVTVDLSDVLEADEDDDLSLSVVGRDIPASGARDNLVLEAARLLAREAGVAPRARIRLDKRIPVGAGLGGGSSDAACALRMLGALWGTRVAEDDLARLALALGSDVPFFLVGGEADISGRGEVVLPRADEPPVEILLLFPPFSISTREAFEAFSRETGGRATLPAHLDVETSGNFFGPNELASAVLGMNSAMKSYLASAAEAASERAMTGSGSTVVLRGTSEETERLLAQRHPEATWTRTRTLPRESYRARQDPRARTSPPGGSPWKSHR
jgi:4-diphosphocytidyl-2-C-methyl-D-erythritol kinase